MNIIDTLRNEINKLHLALPWGACAAQVAMEARCKDEAYKEILAALDKIKVPEIDIDSEIYLWLRKHGSEETARVIAMTARHFYNLGKKSNG